MEPSHDHLQKQHELEQHEVSEVLGFLKRYGRLIGAGIAAAVIVALGSTAVRNYRTARIADAEQALMNAQSDAELEEIITRYRSTPVAPVALLNLARIRFNNGDTAAARAQYERFLGEFKTHEMAAVARLGMAHCTEADGDFSAAAAAFSDFAKAHSGHWLYPSAVLGQSRCLKQAGRTDEARIVLEDFLADYAGTRWAAAAQGALQQTAR